MIYVVIYVYNGVVIFKRPILNYKKQKGEMV